MAAVAEAKREAGLAGPSVTGRVEGRLFEPGGRGTLEDSILRVWEDLAATGDAECPVCGGPLQLAGDCAGCGSGLS